MNVALQTLEKAAAKNKKLGTIVSSLSKVARQLKNLDPSLSSHSPASQFRQTLITLFSTDILPLYQALPKQTLAVTACVVSAIYGTQLSMFLTKVGSEEGVQREWEDVLDMGVVEGLLTYMQSKSCDRETVARTLYPVVCPMLYQGSSDKLGVILRRQVCSLLTDSATNHKANKALLVDTAVFGATRLGEVLARTNDYLLIDGLLELIALLAPRRTADRKDFAEEVFFNPTAVEKFGPGGARRLVVILAEAGGDWLKTSLELNRYMGIANIEKPQIFPMENLVIMGQPILQTDKDKHVCIDRRAVFSAIPDPENENAIDTLEIPINTLHQIRISEVVGNKINIQVSLILTSPPLLASTPMDGPKDGGMFVAKFEVKKDSVERLREVIRARSLSDKCRDNTLLQLPERKVQRNAASSQPLYLPQPEPKYASPSTGERRRRISSHDLEGPVQVEVVPPKLARPVVTKTGKAVPSEKKSSNTTTTKVDPIPVDDLSDLSDASEEFDQRPPPPGRLSKSTKRTRVDSPLSSPSTVKSVKPSPKSLTKPKTTPEDLKAKPKRKRVDDEDEVQLVEEALRPKRARKSEEKDIQPSSPVPKSTKVGAKQGQGKSTTSRALAHKSGAGAKPRLLESAKTRPKPRMLGKKTADDVVGKGRPVEKGSKKPASVTASDTEEVIVISEEEEPLTSVHHEPPLDSDEPYKDVKATPVSTKPAKSKRAPWLVDSEKEQPSSETGIKLGVLPSDEADPLSDPFVTPVSGEQGQQPAREDEFGLDPITPVLEGLDLQRKREGKGGEGGLRSGTHGEENRKLNAGAALYKIEPESRKRTSPTRATTDVLPTIEENVDENDEDHLEPAGSDDIGDITLTNALDGTVGRNTVSKEVNHELETPSRKVVTFAAKVTEHPVPVLPKIKELKQKGVVSAKEVKVKPAQTEHSTRGLLQLDVPKRTKPKASTITASKKYEAKQQALKDPVNELLDEMDQPIETEDEYKAIIKVLDAVRTDIVDRLRTKFQGVRAEARIARDCLFHQARQDLQDIQEHNVRHYEQIGIMVQEFQSQRMVIQEGYTQLAKRNVDILAQVKMVVREHDAQVMRLAKRGGRGIIGEVGETFLKYAAGGEDEE